MSETFDSALVWLRRDLRCSDNVALHHALRCARKVWCVFIFDRDILDELPRDDRRVGFIHASLETLHRQLQQLGASAGTPGVGLITRHGQACDEVAGLAAALGVQAVFVNHDDDPAALRRDAQVGQALRQIGVALRSHQDHVIFERSQILTARGQPMRVFTPYKNAWLKALTPQALQDHPIACYANRLAPLPPQVTAPLPRLAELGFNATPIRAPGLAPGSDNAQRLLSEFLRRIDDYAALRDRPACVGPSELSVHLRFGTISIRALARAAWQRMSETAKAGSGSGTGSPAGASASVASPAAAAGAATWLSELVWRDFYHQILHHHPHVVQFCFKPECDRIEWDQGADAHARFEAWCRGQTGYPLVDAAMAQINQTGHMHNRLRMVVASFLVKDLGLDWRWGERYFAQHLNDYDLAANNGGWQWAASTGCDAQPWFRIFNPVLQSQKFDAQGAFIRRYVPALAALPDDALHAPWAARPMDLISAGVVLGRDYPRPVVDHGAARLRTLARYQAALGAAPSATEAAD